MKQLNLLAKGSKHLCLALMEDLKEIGWSSSNPSSWHEGVKGVAMNPVDPKPWLSSCEDRFFKHIYILPQDYDAVLNVVKEHMAELNKPKFKVGDWAINTTKDSNGKAGLIVDVKTEIGEDFEWPLEGDVTTFPEHYSLATKEEVEATLIRWARHKGIKIGETIEFTARHNNKWIKKVSGLEWNGYQLKITHKRGDISKSENGDWTNDHTAYWGDIFSGGKWLISDIKPHVEKLTFGGHLVEIKLTSSRKDVLIISQMVSAYYSSMVKLRDSVDTLSNIKFGPHKLEVALITKHSFIKFGCTSGTYGEVLEILKACEELLKNQK